MFVLSFTFLIGIPEKKVEAKNRNFAGKYQVVEKYDGYKDYYIFKLKQYKKPKNGSVGEVEVIQMSTYRLNVGCTMKLKKGKGSNVYNSKYKKVKFRIKVNKNSIEVSQKKQNLIICYDFTGTYKLKKRYKKS